MSSGRILWVLAIVCAPIGAVAADWSQWRGPAFNGTTTEKNLPAQWDKAKNVLWATTLPGPSAATPAVLDDRVFLTAIDSKTRDLLGLCLSRADGKILWQKTLGIGAANRRNNDASPSPVADEKRVYFLFGTADLAALDHDGKTLWSRDLRKDFGDIYTNFGYSSSPLLYKGKLYVNVLHRSTAGGRFAKDSYLLALDPATGKDLFRFSRPSGAREESLEAYTTPVPIDTSDGPRILVAGGDAVTAHDPDTGKILWTWTGYNARRAGNFRVVPSVVAGDGLVVFCAPQRSPVYAFTIPKKNGDPAPVWTNPTITSDVCTPARHDGRLYLLNGDNQTLYCLDEKTGKVLWSGNLGGRAVFRASPTIADGKIYCINEDGEVSVMALGDKFNRLATIGMGEGPVRSTITASNGQLFIRTAERLYCIGTKP